MDPLKDPLKSGAERVVTDRRRRPTAHPWADAYLRAHGIQDAGLRAEILAAILARTASRRSESRGFEGTSLEDEHGMVMEEAQRFLDERLASFVGGLAPGQEAIAGRLVFWLAGGPAQAPAALLDPTRAPAALRFQMRTTRIPRMPAIARASMASRRAPEGKRPERAHPQRWLSLTLCLLSLVLLTCR
jgi:hypothetical protein